MASLGGIAARFGRSAELLRLFCQPQPATTLLSHGAFASRRLIRHAHAAGVQVLAWNLDQPLALRHKLLDGVYGIISRYPAKLAGVRAKLETEARSQLTT